MLYSMCFLFGFRLCTWIEGETVAHLLWSCLVGLPPKPVVLCSNVCLELFLCWGFIVPEEARSRRRGCVFKACCLVTAIAVTTSRCYVSIH